MVLAFDFQGHHIGSSGWDLYDDDHLQFDQRFTARGHSGQVEIFVGVGNGMVLVFGHSS